MTAPKEESGSVNVIGFDDPVMDTPLLTDSQKREIILYDSVSLKLGNEYLAVTQGARQKFIDYLI